MQEENDNLYILNEVEDSDSSPYNFASLKNENPGGSEEELKNEKKRNTSALARMFAIMFNPVEGWKNLRRSNVQIEFLQSGCFYPILTVLAISKFADFYYSVNVSLSKIITESVISFVAFFFGYFCVLMVMNWILPEPVAEKFNEKFGKEFTIISMSTLALFSIFTDLFPMLWPILIFLPIWTLYIMYKGVRFFKFSEHEEIKFFVLASASMIGVPLLIDWGLNTIMPL